MMSVDLLDLDHVRHGPEHAANGRAILLDHFVLVMTQTEGP